MKLYIAYGSNMDKAQMVYRGPGAICFGTAVLKDWRLMFKYSSTGAYATIEKEKGYNTPVTLWAISDYHEKKLDRYEGYPYCYYKQTIQFDNFKVLPEFADLLEDVDVRNIKYGLVYILPKSRPFGLPSETYYNILNYAYEDFGFDTSILNEAVIFSNTRSRLLSKKAMKVKYKHRILA